MAHLASLPVELFDTILEFLPTTSLLMLHRTCTAIRKATLDALYRRIYAHIELTWDGRPAAATKNPPLGLLLRTLLTTPEVVHKVQSFTLSSVGFGVHVAFDDGMTRLNMPSVSKLTTDALSVSDVAAAQSALESADLSHCKATDLKRWAERLETGMLDDILGLILILLLPTLEKLVLPLGFQVQDTTISKALASALPRAKELVEIDLSDNQQKSLNQDYIHSNLTLSHFLPVFYAPALEKATLVLPDFERRSTRQTTDWPSPQGPATATSLACLQLRTSRIPDGALSEILRQTPNLSTLIYEHHGLSGIRPFDGIALRAGLESIRNTLHTLHIDLWVVSTGGDPSWAGRSSILSSLGSLQSLSSLTTLRVPFIFLLGWAYDDVRPKLADHLPRSIEHLELTDHLFEMDECEWDEDAAFETVETFARVWREITPSLKRIVIDFSRTTEFPQEQLQTRGRRVHVLCGDLVEVEIRA